jgi:predicted dehydrogenase
MVSKGQIGSLKIVRAAFCYHMSDAEMSAGTNFRLRPGAGGGALMDVGCYGVSTARWFFGQEPVAVQAQADYHASGVDVHLAGTLKFDNGGLAVVEASFRSALQQTYTLVGDRAVIELPHDAYIPWEKDTVFSVRKADQEIGQTMTIEGADEYRLMIESFADAVRSNTQLAYSPEDSIQNMRVIDALAEAARSGQTVHLGAA